MAKIYSQLEKAQLENTTSDTGSLPKGMITYRTDLNIAKVSNGTSMLALIDESSTQTLSGKTYASPNFTGAFNMAQTTTPSNPSAGSNKFYFKADGKLYTLDSSGNEALVGSGTGGVKNLITNGNADDTASSIFVPYADTGTRPVDGTGGSPTVTTSISSSTPLDGVKSFLLTKPASNVQGQGWAVPFTVDPAYRAKSLKISVDYIINSGTFVAGGAGVESDVIWYIYDVTNSQLIEPSNIKMFSNNSSLSDKFEATFQTSATGASYRLIAHVQSTSASAFELKVDNITVSPQSYVFGTPASDLVNTYTPTIAGLGTGGVSAATIKWGRFGDNLIGRLTWTKDGSAGTGGSTVTMTLPFTVDSTKVNGTGDVVGNGYSSNGTVFQARLNGVYNQINLIRADTSATLTGSDVGAGRTYYIDLIFPVSGWSSSVQMSDSADTRQINAIVGRTTSQTGINPNNSAVKLLFDVVSKDTHGAYDTGNTRYVAPSAGDYDMFAYVEMDATNVLNSRYFLRAYKNGSNQGSIALNVPAAGQFFAFNVPYTFRDVKAGDYLELYIFGVGNNSVSTITMSNNSYLSFAKKSGPSAIAASETVSAEYTTAAGQSIANGADTLVDFGTKTFDSHNAVTTGGSWKFTAPVSGTYLVSAVCALGYTASSAVSGESIIYLYKNGASVGALGGRNHDVSNMSMAMVAGSKLVKLNAGDYADVRFYQNNGASKNLEASAIKNRISIVRIGL